MKKQAIVFLTVMTILAYNQFHINQHHKNLKRQNQLEIYSLDMNFQELFSRWMIKFHKSYKSQMEERYRLKIFIQRCKIIYNHNMNKDKLGYTYTLGLNQFSDQTDQEYSSRLKSIPLRNKKINHSGENLGITLQCTGTITSSPNPPVEVDWTKRAVTPVLDQGQCGSSYAFSAIGAIQGLYASKMGKIQVFSTQQIIDCSGNYGNQGCDGGFMDQAFWYIVDNGLATSKSYPLTNPTKANTCNYTKNMRATSISKCADVPSGNYQKLLSAVVQQPTAAAIDGLSIRDFSQGIYNGNCSDTSLNQAILIVGYGTEDNQTYWNIKNSLGESWGHSGYIKLPRIEQDGPGRCGIQLVATVPQSIV